MAAPLLFRAADATFAPHAAATARQNFRRESAAIVDVPIGRRLLLFEHRKDVACGVFEPRYLWTWAAEDTSLVGLELALVVALKAHTPPRQLGHRLFDVGHGEIENGESRRSMVGLGIDEHLGSACQVQLKQPMRFRDLQPESSAVKIPRLL